MDEENKLHLTELISVDILQQIQDAFSELTHMAAQTADSKGAAITQASNSNEFCIMCRKTEIGRRRCEKCDIDGAKISQRYNNAYTYRCHAGLVEFASPIISNGEVRGSFIGGRVFVDEPDIASIRQTAVEVGLDPDKCEEMVKRIPVVGRDRVEQAARFLCSVAHSLLIMPPALLSDKR